MQLNNKKLLFSVIYLFDALDFSIYFCFRCSSIKQWTAQQKQHTNDQTYLHKTIKIARKYSLKRIFAPKNRFYGSFRSVI